MVTNEDPSWEIELQRAWQDGFESGMSESEVKNLNIIEDLLIKIRNLQAQLGEFRHPTGEYIQ